MPVKASWIYAFIAAACAGLLGYALYTEHFQGLVPCPLCMTQRLFFVLSGGFALLALIHRPGVVGRRVYAVLMVLSAGAGAGVAGRQVWLQSLPADQVPACGPSLEYMFDVLPLAEAFKTLMMGDGNCAEIDWTFLGLSMAGWALVWFVGLALAALLSLRGR